MVAPLRSKQGECAREMGVVVSLADTPGDRTYDLWRLLAESILFKTAHYRNNGI